MVSSEELLFLQTARELAAQASTLIVEHLRLPIEKKYKEDDSPVTNADLQADAILREGLLNAFPHHGLLSEETGLAGSPDAEYVWVIDPLDGTKAFAKKIPGFCVMVGLLKRGKPYLGVLHDPWEGRVYEAIRGQGAYHVDSENRRSRLHVSSRKNLTQMPLVISTGFPPEALEKIRQRLPGPLVDPINSVGIKVGLLVRQVGDLYLNHHGVHYWDTCAPLLVLEEAGGRMTALNGAALSYDLHRGFDHGHASLASNGLLHSEVLEVLRELALSLGWDQRILGEGGYFR